MLGDIIGGLSLMDFSFLSRGKFHSGISRAWKGVSRF